MTCPRVLHNCSWGWWCDDGADDGNGGSGTHGDVDGNGGGVWGGGDSRGVHGEYDKGRGDRGYGGGGGGDDGGDDRAGMEVMMEDGHRIPSLYFPGTQRFVLQAIL